MSNPKLTPWGNPTPMEDFFNGSPLDSIIAGYIKQLENNKERIFKERIEELELPVSWEEEERRVFKSFAKIRHEDGYSETIVYNDGSILGKKIVTFIDQKPVLPKGSQEINISFKYHFHE